VRYGGDHTLVDSEILEAVRTKRLVIEDFDPSTVNPASSSLRIGEVFCLSERKTWEPYNLSKQGMYELQPFESVLISTLEAVRMPKDVTGRLSLKQNWSNQGIDYNPGSIDPTYSGKLWLMIRNVGLNSVTLQIGLPIVNVEWTVLEHECTTVFQKAVLNPPPYDEFDDLPADKKPLPSKRKLRTWSDINSEMDKMDLLTKMIEIMIPMVMIPLVIAIIALVFNTNLTALHWPGK